MTQFRFAVRFRPRGGQFSTDSTHGTHLRFWRYTAMKIERKGPDRTASVGLRRQSQVRCNPEQPIDEEPETAEAAFRTEKNIRRRARLKHRKK
jgi:hypothetical protein